MGLSTIERRRRSEGGDGEDQAAAPGSAIRHLSPLPSLPADSDYALRSSLAKSISDLCLFPQLIPDCSEPDRFADSMCGGSDQLTPLPPGLSTKITRRKCTCLSTPFSPLEYPAPSVVSVSVIPSFSSFVLVSVPQFSFLLHLFSRFPGSGSPPVAALAPWHFPSSLLCYLLIFPSLLLPYPFMWYPPPLRPHICVSCPLDPFSVTAFLRFLIMPFRSFHLVL